MKKNSNKSSLVIDYRFKQIGEDFLVTTNHGSWSFLTKEEFEELRKESIKEGSEFFKKLEEKGIILTEKNKEKVINRLKERNNFLYNGASLHIVIPTLRCNFNCIYCHAASKPIDAKGYDMDEKTAKAVVNFIFQSPSKAITIEFQGGEPLLNFDIIKYIIEYAKKSNEYHKKELLFTVVTNSSLMDKEKLNYFVKNDVNICTSLDGPPILHNQNRPFMKNKESYSFVKKTIEQIEKEYKKNKINSRRINALITITKDSLPLWKEIIDTYVELNMKEIHLRFLNRLGSARQIWGSLSYTPEQFIDFWKKSIDYILELNKKGVHFRERTSSIIIQKILTESDPNFLDIRSPCGAVIGQLAYTPQGDIYTCDEARMVEEDLFKLGNVKKDNYKQILSSNQTCSFISSSINDGQICDYCVYKPYCGICPICNFVEQGSIIAKIPETARCKIYKEQFTYIFNKIRDSENKKIFLDWIGGEVKDEKREYKVEFSKA